MGEDVLPSYLRNKLSSVLDEAEADSDIPSPITSRFRSIETQIKSNSMMMIIPVDLLYELIELVSECRVFSFERRTAVVSKKGFGFYLYFPKLLRHPPLSKWMFNRRMRRRLDSIARKIASTRGSPPPPRGPVIEQTYPIMDRSLIIGFEAEADAVEAWLMPSQEEGDEAAAALKVSAVGIVGSCGCGKTALAQKVFDSPSVKKEFSPRIWVCLSKMLLDNDRKVRVVKHMLREIHGHADDHCSLDKLMERLQMGLRGKRYLIVLDNAWRLDEWYEELLSHGLPRGSGGAVIVTSRREDVIRRMVADDKHVIRLQPHLSDEICWQIFSNEVKQQGKMDLTDPKLASIEDDVKRNFDGLPLAAKILANILPDIFKMPKKLTYLKARRLHQVMLNSFIEQHMSTGSQKYLANILPNLLLKTYWVRARDLRIWNGDDDNYWRWTFLPPPQEMEEVAELVGGKEVFIRGRVELKELFRNTSYSAYLVFKLKTKDPSRLNPGAVAGVRIVCYGKSPGCERERIVNLKTEGRQRKGKDEQGWMEINLGHFSTTSGDDGGLVEADFSHYDATYYEQTGLVVKGIELRPA